MNVFDELKARGLIAQTTHEDEIRDKLTNEKVTFYIGFDATANSLTAGHFLQLVVVKHMMNAGHQPILMLGGGTTMIGDPSGRTDMRQMLTREIIDENVECFKRQFIKVLDIKDDNVLMVNNADWLLDVKYVDFLRNVGVHFSVNRMLAAECFKSRLERGLSFFEFNYMLMQSYDFLVLNDKFNCTMELGGDDQWSNIIGGVELVRRSKSKQVYGMTFNLLTTSSGVKMGKTAKGAVWLDPERTSPFDFYQYWRNVDDKDCIRFLKMLTFVPLEEIAEMQMWENSSKINDAKEVLAYEITKMVHGADEADKAKSAAKALFGKGVEGDENIPTTIMDKEKFENGMGIIDLMVDVNLCPSRAEGRRLIQQGGVSIDGNKVEDFNLIVKLDNFTNDEILLKKGKKVFHKVKIK
ncbi:MAG: tyrosine--tRNA ligase [Clostridiales bacterium]|jgi:tyrosyl-tRNA synthetase|nr:tyrosine--tRNA ligase [Clostridiales bacterium]